jgi:hypothetical protein
MVPHVIDGVPPAAPAVDLPEIAYDVEAPPPAPAVEVTLGMALHDVLAGGADIDGEDRSITVESVQQEVQSDSTVVENGSDSGNNGDDASTMAGCARSSAAVAGMSSDVDDKLRMHIRKRRRSCTCTSQRGVIGTASKRGEGGCGQAW